MVRRSVFIGVLALCGASSLNARAEDVDSVEKSIVEKLEKITSLQMKNTAWQTSDIGGAQSETDSKSTLEYQKKDGRMLYRTEAVMDTVMNVQGNKQKTTSKVLSVCDGEFMYVLTETPEQKSAMKMKMPPDQNMMDRAWFESMRKMYTLKLLPDETVNGASTWVIEATARDTAQPGVVGRIVTNFDKATGLSLKSTGHDSAGKVVLKTASSDVKVNPSISADRFTFKAPEGVQLVDMTQMGQNQPQGQQPQPAEETATAKAEPKEEQPKPAEEKPAEDAKKPRLPKLPKLKKP